MANRLILFRSMVSQRWLCTATTTSTKGVTEDKKGDSLYGKLLQLNIKPESDTTDITEILNEWFNKGKPVKKFAVVQEIDFFRSLRRYPIALQLSEWMETNKIKISNGDRAKRIDLLAKTKGITSAEKYFDSLQASAKTVKTYGALLNCYCKEKLLDKALEHFSKMKELGFVSALNYNNLISLYLNSKQPEKVPLLVEDMKQKKIKPDLYTYNLLMNSYASQKDLDAVEEVLERMKADDVKCDWFTYGNLATIYVNAGLNDKAEALIEKIEKFENLHDREAFHTLITLYRRLSDLSGVNRTWASLKSVYPAPNNTSYLLMLIAFSELGDLESLEKYFREWESGCSIYDVRLCNVLLDAYLKRDMIEEANVLYDSVLKRGSEPHVRTLDLLTNYHLKNNQVDLALKYLEMGVSKANPRWFPNDETIKMFLKYFEENDDVTRAEKFCNSLKKVDRLDSSVYDSCTKTTAHEVEA